MQRSAFEVLLQSAAGDGGAATFGRRSTPRVELEDLMQAWSIERSRSVEYEILLELSRAAIADLLATDDRRTSSPDHLQDLRALLRRIDTQLDAGPSDRA